MKTGYKLTLNHLKKNQHKKANFQDKPVLIWSSEWQAWWKPKACGYTDNIEEAGVFDFEDAWRRSCHCGPEKKISYHTVA